MKNQTKIHKSIPVIIAITLSASIATIHGQGPGGRTPRKHTATEARPIKLVPATHKAPAKNEVEIVIKDGFRFINANDIPGHKVGKFPNRGNPNQISPQETELKLPLEPQVNKRAIPARTAVGVLLNGVYLEAGTGEFWMGERGSQWNYEALGGAVSLGLDANHAHVQPTGKYHYHGIPTGYLADTGLSTTKHSPLVGWAFDGFPIYALYGFSNPDDPTSGIVEMTSSFRLKAGTRPEPPEGPGGTYDGAFTADYEYVKGTGTLDECNGRFTKTPEFPEGTYAYFISNKWPVIFRNYRGTPAVQPHGRPEGANGPDRRGRRDRPGRRPAGGTPPGNHSHGQ